MYWVTRKDKLKNMNIFEQLSLDPIDGYNVNK